MGGFEHVQVRPFGGGGSITKPGLCRLLPKFAVRMKDLVVTSQLVIQPGPKWQL